MSWKRSHSTYESDWNDGDILFVRYGTPIRERANGSGHGEYRPLHKQEVRDSQGRRRLHGAFTGGWTAGYHNTVGSLEGWTPSQFVSSRTARHSKQFGQLQKTPEDYMDDEDITDILEAQHLTTTGAFSGVGQQGGSQMPVDGLLGLLERHHTMGIVLLGKMGWREGQGIGPKVWRKARGDPKTNTNTTMPGIRPDMFLFAPEDVTLTPSLRKPDRAGVDHKSRLVITGRNATTSRLNNRISQRSGENDVSSPTASSLRVTTRDSPSIRGTLGKGLAYGSDSEPDTGDDIGPRLTLATARSGKKRNNRTKPRNDQTSQPPMNISSNPSRAVCHDGTLSLPGFRLWPSKCPELDTSNATFQHPHPLTIPQHWKPRGHGMMLSPQSSLPPHTSQPPAAGDSAARARILGEPQLPGRSVFDYMTPAMRERLVAASKNSNLPPGKGLKLESGSHVSAGIEPPSQRNIHLLDPEVARAALARDRAGSGPYMTDEIKRARYHRFLAYSCGLLTEPPMAPDGVSDADFRLELKEFCKCAEIFKPMVGPIASRFTTSSPSSSALKPGHTAQHLIGKESGPNETAFEGAKLGMFGPVTRSESRFSPQRLLCKRFNVKPPLPLGSPSEEQVLAAEAKDEINVLVDRPLPTQGHNVFLRPSEDPAGMLDGKKDGVAVRPPQEVFTAIFGESSDEEKTYII
ncbi:hypothetical protein jhhlp_000189 [Lomentospora prolificans]|uniref:G-patch domain-containing protein n=1 Tax=Lomentospora prolificans TaxID=41688 RepID=A0A2N3NK76_9PEZI|nr:hypothetical protein jhhlp_000189 [Lomentospora prolificans]